MEITSGDSVQLAFIIRLGLSDNLAVIDDEKYSNSVCVFQVLSACLLAEGCRVGEVKGGKLGRTAISLIVKSAYC